MKKLTNHRNDEIFEILGGQIVYDDFHIQYIEKYLPGNSIQYPFSGDSNVLFVLLEGQLKINVNMEIYEIKEKSIILLPPKAYIHFLEASNTINSILVSFSNDFALANLSNYVDVNILKLLINSSTFVTSLSNDKFRNIVGLIENLYLLNDKRDEIFVKERMYHYFNAMILELIAPHHKENGIFITQNNRQKELIQRFMKILTLNFKQERSVRFYADQLAVTSGYLTRVLKDNSGFSASAIIEDFVVIEARNLIQNSGLSIAQIAEELNFSDQSFFGKFFKKKMKISPMEFKKQRLYKFGSNRKNGDKPSD